MEKYHNLVHSILLDDRDARNSDKVLYIKVIKELAPELAKKPFEVSLMHEDLPSYNSVSRIRRRWQAKDHDCMSDIQIQRWRAKKELDYREEYGHA